MHYDLKSILEKEGQLMVWVTPGARITEILGFQKGPHDRDYLKIKVGAPPEDGRANEAVIKLLSEKTGIAKSRLVIASGLTTPFKRVVHTSAS